ncbi:hypothetical protein JMJ77_0012985 [Colletotrichum scovillei]|uniref:Uncharacterized protein n=1 Tax=Colletotrichum scovillei TaxID=1209932 RepID=A0A9P7R4U6_9PEZI|nr:hypothetical protein JMJ77_0012985 [Colletotrichum scovillei]KAG7069273.1 hypothetical protein JMJ76_0002946 [Colletotrichum scovillei]KAG7073187.1 hypothetical protein JMJ78_0014166 [Colletotrichum scovillei]
MPKVLIAAMLRSPMSPGIQR